MWLQIWLIWKRLKSHLLLLSLDLISFLPNIASPWCCFRFFSKAPSHLFNLQPRLALNLFFTSIASQLRSIGEPSLVLTNSKGRVGRMEGRILKTKNRRAKGGEGEEVGEKEKGRDEERLIQKLKQRQHQRRQQQRQREKMNRTRQSLAKLRLKNTWTNRTLSCLSWGLMNFLV